MFREVRETSKVEREVEKHFDPNERIIPSGRTATSCLVKNVQKDDRGRVIKFEVNLENPDGLNSGDLNKLLREAEKVIGSKSVISDEDRSKGWVNLPFGR